VAAVFLVFVQGDLSSRIVGGLSNDTRRRASPVALVLEAVGARGGPVELVRDGLG